MTEEPFGVDNLPYGVFAAADGTHVGVRVADQVLDLARLFPERAPLFVGSLNPFLRAGPDIWDEVRAALQERLTDRRAVEQYLVPLDDVEMVLPFEPADYVDFYASEHHARNLGAMFRPDQPALPANWKHLPIGYHGRAGTLVVSGSPVHRPHGQRRTPDGTVLFGPSTRLDIEAELGFVVGVPSPRGRAVPLRDFDRHVFGVCLVNDWSARDIQAWEYVPLGPFLGKSFATSVSAWITPLSALRHARVRPPARDVPLLDYLDDADEPDWGLDIALEVSLNGHVVSSPPFASMYWTGAQQLVHMTVNGAALRTGDFFASGTISGPEPAQRGSFIELSWGGREPLTQPDGTTRTFLENGDEVVITATAPGPEGSRIALGEVRGRVEPEVL